ncbi:cryptochrome/photolyase family protein [Marinigracilibium pacificum]|uniref:Deoxyribodipyrimidine photo-lyase n=1 Tax=Marinigracilibium pacificum TaxID=2729599 RepID=A0A848J7Y2_9BACT|nr:deoxyribodipyrimidine photo-lyase [Marinigracilibium pacificum]NMM50534.1 deoxyribodipyrimidine photo-lyase [Marinigracilibium pacificum]
MTKEKINIFWFRRDLRTDDNHGLYEALKSEHKVLPIFIFDRQILDDLEDKKDPRVMFISDKINELHASFQKHNSGLLTFYDTPEEAFQSLTQEYNVDTVYCNRDYEPYARQRDEKIEEFLKSKNIGFNTYKDQVIFEKYDILTQTDSYYKVFTPYSRTWLDKWAKDEVPHYWSENNLHNLYETTVKNPHQLSDMGFERSEIEIPTNDINENIIETYDETRDIPKLEKGTTHLGIHLRFGTISIRKLAKKAAELNKTYLNELIWREFYMMILFFNPQVVNNNFKPKYDAVQWINDAEKFQKWCEGKTGYPLVDAGMRQLNQTGYMHNRVRMVVASFLCKHLLIDWRWGEAYFAKKLLDYELASNNGGWQWAAGTGTDAQPYFRVFNPSSQLKKFDPDMEYIKKWVPEILSGDYPKPIVEHKAARERAIKTYEQAVK